MSSLVTENEWANVEPEERKNFLGSKLFTEISKVHPHDAPKLTGMFLEMANEDLIKLLNRPKLFKKELHSAFTLLQQSPLPSAPPDVSTGPPGFLPMSSSSTGTGVVEKVKTNQRGLITKILSR